RTPPHTYTTHHAKNARHVDGKPESREQRERADDRDRHRGQRDQGSAPVLQEDEHNENNQGKRLEKRGHHVTHSSPDKPGGVVGNLVFDAGGKVGLGVLEERANPVGGVDRVGARRQKHNNDARGFLVNPAEVSVVLRTQLHTPEIVHAQERSVRLGSDHDPVELLRLEQSAGGVYRVLEVRSRGNGRLADRACSVLAVLRLDRNGEVGGGNTELRHLVRIDPDAHSIVFGRDQACLAHAGNTADLVHQVNGGVVIQKQRIIPAVGGYERDSHQESG